MSAARFEIVRTDAEQPWHARFVAANGRIVWTTEQYARRGKALAAVELICGDKARSTPFNEHLEIGWQGGDDLPTEIRDVDERTAS